MVGEAGAGNVLLRLETESVTVAFRGVFCSVNGEGLRIFSEICIQNALETLLPSGGKSLVRVLCNSLDIALEHCVELALHRLFGSIVHTCHLCLRHESVKTDYIENVLAL